MAIVVIGGLITSTFLSLLVIPVVFTFVDDGVQKLKHCSGTCTCTAATARRRRRAAPCPAPPTATERRRGRKIARALLPEPRCEPPDPTPNS
jgi:hypothetical protein